MDQTRKYRLRVFDGMYEVLADRTYAVVVDLDTQTAAGVLDRQLAVLTEQARADGEPMTHPRLIICDWLTGGRILDWAGS